MEISNHHPCMGNIAQMNTVYASEGHKRTVDLQLSYLHIISSNLSDEGKSVFTHPPNQGTHTAIYI